MPDRLDDAVEIAVDFVEAQGAKPAVREVVVTDGIVRRICIEAMLRAVDLDDQPRPQTDEVEDVAPERRLPAEVMTLPA